MYVCEMMHGSAEKYGKGVCDLGICMAIFFLLNGVYSIMVQVEL